jgi:hypothetical protein
VIHVTSKYIRVALGHTKGLKVVVSHFKREKDIFLLKLSLRSLFPLGKRQITYLQDENCPLQAENFDQTQNKTRA